MIEQIQDRIEKLNDIGQPAFEGTDYTFGYNTWKSGTLTLLRRLFPLEKEIIKQIQDIELRRVDHNKTDSSGYNLEACKNEAEEILQVLIETISQTDKNTQPENNQEFWGLLHPRVIQLAKPRFDNGQYADAVLACLREINTIVKDHVKRAINQELDGAPLMTRAFSAQNPLIEFGDLTSESGRNLQIGYMKIFEGAMIGIRNPKAHANMNPDENKSLHLLFITSFMFIKLQEAGLVDNEK